MTIDDLQIAGIRHHVMESLKSAVRYPIALCPRCFRRKIQSCVSMATYSFSNLVHCRVCPGFKW